MEILKTGSQERDTEGDDDPCLVIPELSQWFPAIV